MENDSHVYLAEEVSVSFQKFQNDLTHFQSIFQFYTP